MIACMPPLFTIVPAGMNEMSLLVKSSHTEQSLDFPLAGVYGTAFRSRIPATWNAQYSE